MAFVVMLFTRVVAPVQAQDRPNSQPDKLDANLAAAVDHAVQGVLKSTGVPGASITIVHDGQIAYERAYGFAQLDPARPLTAAMRFKIASNSKQMTAAAVLLLAEEGKLSLDDPVARYLPGLTRAQDISLRQLLAHTAGYPDYYAPDYSMPSMHGPAQPETILARWATQPLTFEPGSRYQYSNTGYVAVGEVVRKVSGKPLFDVLQERIFKPLGMSTAIDADSVGLSREDPIGYTRHGLGPQRPAVYEGPGWMAAAGELAMSASDLARWDIALMSGRVLAPASLKQMVTAQPLSGGSASNYGLGLGLKLYANGHRRWAHTGGAAGFLSFNAMYPDDRMALVVLTNGEGFASKDIAEAVEKLLLTETDPQAAPSMAQVRAALLNLQQGRVNRAVLTQDLADYLDAQALKDMRDSLRPLGEMRDLAEKEHSLRGGMVFRKYIAQFTHGSVSLEVYVRSDGRLEQLLVLPNES